MTTEPMPIRVPVPPPPRGLDRPIDPAVLHRVLAGLKALP
jgi:hypothetical protein